jgi:hypothetical protein
MKRYDCVEEDNLIKRDKEFIAQVDEAVRIERAKDRKNYEDALTDMVKEKNDEIARLRKALECIRTEIKGKYTLTGLFDLIENLAREALEGE